MEFWKIQQNDPPRVRWKGRVIFDPEGNCAPEELPQARFPRKIGVEGQDGSEEGPDGVRLVSEQQSPTLPFVSAFPAQKSGEPQGSRRTSELGETQGEAAQRPCRCETFRTAAFQNDRHGSYDAEAAEPMMRPVQPPVIRGSEEEQTRKEDVDSADEPFGNGNAQPRKPHPKQKENNARYPGVNPDELEEAEV